jgi:hypothetical protein
MVPWGRETTRPQPSSDAYNAAAAKFGRLRRGRSPVRTPTVEEQFPSSLALRGGVQPRRRRRRRHRGGPRSVPLGAVRRVPRPRTRSPVTCATVRRASLKARMHVEGRNHRPSKNEPAADSGATPWPTARRGGEPPSLRADGRQRKGGPPAARARGDGRSMGSGDDTGDKRGQMKDHLQTTPWHETRCFPRHSHQVAQRGGIIAKTLSTRAVATTPCFRCLDNASGDAPLKPAELPPNPKRCVGEAGTG